MKYIRGQDGGIYSVSRLKPPCRHTHEGEAIWRMSVVTWSGEYITYATFRTEALAIKAYKSMTDFMLSFQNMIVFRLGVDGEAPTLITKGQLDCTAVGPGGTEIYGRRQE